MIPYYVAELLYHRTENSARTQRHSRLERRVWSQSISKVKMRNGTFLTDHIYAGKARTAAGKIWLGLHGYMPRAPSRSQNSGVGLYAPMTLMLIYMRHSENSQLMAMCSEELNHGHVLSGEFESTLAGKTEVQPTSSGVPGVEGSRQK